MASSDEERRRVIPDAANECVVTQPGMELVEQLEDIEAIIVDPNGRVLISSGLRNRVRFSHGLDESKLNH